MIATLRGIVLESSLDSVVIECGGVGYEVFVTPNTNARLVKGEEAFVYVEHIVRETDEMLFGFTSQADRKMFRAIQTVSGIGPKIANAALACFSAEELGNAIDQGDAKQIQKIPGVGKKSAERICLELKDKIGGIVEIALPAHTVVQPALDTNAVSSQVVEALVGLGFSDKQADAAVAQVMAASEQNDASAILSAALKTLSANK